MRRARGMFDGQLPEPDIQHSIPADDFAHEESMECPCGAYTHAVPGIGAAICHRGIYAKDFTVPDFPPA